MNGPRSPSDEADYFLCFIIACGRCRSSPRARSIITSHNASDALRLWSHAPPPRWLSKETD